MDELLQRGLGFLGDMLWGAFEVLSGFFLQFFPDADMAVVNTINGWGDVMQGGTLTCNVFYFIDMPVVSVFVGIALACATYKMLQWMVFNVLWLVDKLIEKIPVIE